MNRNYSGIVPPLPQSASHYKGIPPPPPPKPKPIFARRELEGCGKEGGSEGGDHACFQSDLVRKGRENGKQERQGAGVVMQRLSYLTETVLFNKIARNRIVPSFKDSPSKPLGR